MAKIDSNVRKTKSSFKGHFSGHETFPLRQIWLTRAFRYAAAHNFDISCFSLDSAIADLGVGKNMVSAMRHWALASDVLGEDSSGLHPGWLGDILVGSESSPGLDPWFEDTNSIWLVHWALAGRGKRSTTWKWLFSRVGESVIERDKLIHKLTQWCTEVGLASSTNTLKRDVETCLRCYLPRASAASGEEAAEPLLSELSILGTGTTQSTLRFNKGPKRTLGSYTFYFAVLDYWDMKHAALDTRPPETIPMMNIALDFYAPGRVFKLSEEEIETRLLQAETLTDGALVYDESVKNLTVNHSRLTPNGVLVDREANKLDLISRDYRPVAEVL